MMINKQEFGIRAQLKHETLEAWIEEEWLIPSKVGDEMMFSDADLARAQLIQDLKDDLGVNDEGVGVILNLVDQVYGLWRVLSELLRSRPGALLSAMQRNVRS
jgi:chaperone modulatory protein CbpM